MTIGDLCVEKSPWYAPQDYCDVYYSNTLNELVNACVIDNPWLITPNEIKEWKTLLLKTNKEELKQMKEFYIKNYKVCDNNGVKTLVVDFEDGTKEHAVCCADDVFELARGVEVCVMKHIFGRDNYKAMLKTAMRQIKAIDKVEEKAKKEKEMIEAKKKSAARKKARYKANKRAKRVAEMKEAYLAAMREYGAGTCTACEASWDDLK